MKTTDYRFMDNLNKEFSGKNLNLRGISKEDNAIIAKIIRENLKAHKLDLPGTVYFDSNLDYLSDYYLDGNHKRVYFVVTDKSGQVIGGVGLGELPDMEGTCELQKLYLIDRVKGLGIGKLLVSIIQEKGRELGYKKMYLETHDNLDAAICLYKKAGFKEIPRPDFVNHGTMNRFFIKDLKEEPKMNGEFEEFVTFTTTARDGQEIEMALVDEFEFERKNYVVGAKIEGDTINEEGLYIFKGKVVDDELKVEKITDPAEYEKIAKAYMEM